MSVKNTSLAKICDNQSDIMNILRLSYHHLWSPLKNSFAYCALFPKDYEFQKKMLIELWIAVGFIVPSSNDDQSLDDEAEECFHTLLQRGFFRNIKRNNLGVIENCKMHDFMHDLAEEVAGVKCKVAKSDERNFDEKSVHLSLAYQLTTSWEIPNLNMKLLRTFLPLKQARKDGSPQSKLICQMLLTRFRCLRILDLHMLGLQSLPSSIGKLIHLRYLNLSETLIEKLPDSITDLWNLQTLRLYGCSELKTLPANMRKLTNLRCFDVAQCFKLIHMPMGLGGLTSLNSLPTFIVGLRGFLVGAADLMYKSAAKLSDLKNLNNLRGDLHIDIRGKCENTMLEAKEAAADLSSKHGLTELVISSPYDDYDCNYHDAVLEGLKPPSNIKNLVIYHYLGQNMPSWARMDKLCTTHPYLVQITLDGWKWCQELPAFSQLPFLKLLTLGDIRSVEYIESHDVCGVPSSSSTSSIFFPSLEQLSLGSMHISLPNLKGWWKEVEAIAYKNDASESASNELSAQKIPTTFIQLSVINCPNLRLLPLCPNVEDLTIRRTNESLSVLKMATGSGLKLKRLSIDNTEDPNHCLHQLSSLEVQRDWNSNMDVDVDDKLESIDILGDVFITLSSSLRSLRFENCNRLRSIAKGLEHLTALEDLEFAWCREVDASGDVEGMPWKALNASLRSLTLSGLRHLVGLPIGLQHLANLRSLTLSGNHQLKELPEWLSCFSSLQYLRLSFCIKLRCLPEAFRHLTSLNHLEIINCPGLKTRCQGPNGSDWAKIKHIPLLSVRDKY